MNAKQKALNHHRIANRSSHFGDVEGAIDIAIDEAKKEEREYWEKLYNHMKEQCKLFQDKCERLENETER